MKIKGTQQDMSQMSLQSLLKMIKLHPGQKAGQLLIIKLESQKVKIQLILSILELNPL